MEINTVQGNTESTVHIKFSSEEVDKAFHRVYERFRSKINVKGYRPGKAPNRIIKRNYSNEVSLEVYKELVDVEMESHLADIRYFIFSEPFYIAPDQAKEGQAYEFAVKFVHLPVIKLPEDYKENLNVIVKLYHFEETDLDRALELAAIRYSKQEKADLVDANSLISLKSKEGGEEVGISLADQSSADLRPHLVGKKVGDKVTVDGQEVEIISVFSQEILSLEELTKKLGCSDAEDLRGMVGKQLRGLIDYENQLATFHGLIFSFIEESKIKSGMEEFFKSLRGKLSAEEFSRLAGDAGALRLRNEVSQFYVKAIGDIINDREGIGLDFEKDAEDSGFVTEIAKLPEDDRQHYIGTLEQHYTISKVGGFLAKFANIKPDRKEIGSNTMERLVSTLHLK